MRRGLAILFVLGLASSAGAQTAERIAVPVAWRGVVHRIVRSGCGEAWSGDEARSHVTLDVASNGIARLRVDARILSATGGRALLDRGGRYHSEHETTLALAWTGRARTERGALVVRLRALVETVPVDDTTTTVTNRTTEEAVLRCVRETRDVFAASRPTDVVADAATGHRAIVACAFDPREHEGPLPRPVTDALTVPFFVDSGAGVATDALYERYVGASPEYLLAREPGGPDPG